MVDVVGVKFKDAGKVYYFGPGGVQVQRGDHVIVETARGLEYGTVTMGNREVPEEEIVTPLKDIVRVATEADAQKHLQNLEKRDRAMQLCQEKIDAHALEMKLVDVEYTFDNSKVVFYFTADGRVDFRELVKDLAAVFRMRIELRQIGVRDEAKMLGGVGNCGRGLCCLKYENDLYAKLKKGMPNTGERVKTPDGKAIVVDTNILESTVKTRLILEEASPENDNEEKLSTEFYVYDKDEIRRQNKKNNGKKGKGRGKNSGSELDQMDSETKKEIEQLMKD